MSAPRELFDPGLQPERTALAWRRTALSMAGGALVSLRIFPERVGPAGIGLAIVAFAAAVVVVIAASLRYRRDHAVLIASESDRVALSGGGLVALTAATVLLFGAIALVVVLLH
jgi:uncharacterized membrane protein YidH (DUF202 family)